MHGPDVSERAFQTERHGQWTKGKSCDTFGPTGPWLVTKDEVADPQDLAMWLKVNGETMQDGSTKTMVYGAAYLVSYLSQFMSLRPGDIISTGTPPGVGMGMKPPRYLKAGDVVELGIEGLGSQKQRVRATPELIECFLRSYSTEGHEQAASKCRSDLRAPEKARGAAGLLE